MQLRKPIGAVWRNLCALALSAMVCAAAGHAQQPGSPARAGVARAGVEQPGSPARAGVARAGVERPMSFLDVIELRSVSGGTISSDGKLVAYTLTATDWKRGRATTDIYVTTTGSASASLTVSPTPDRSEFSPQWAADGRTLGFLSDRDGADQLYLHRIGGGASRKLTDHRDGVHRYAFSPDGKWVAWTAGRAGSRQLWFAPLDRIEAAAQLTRHVTGVLTWAWDPNSSRIFFVAADPADRENQRRKEKKFDVRIVDEAQPPAHLWSVSLADRSETRWTSGVALNLLQFTVSPDSQFIAFRADSNPRHAEASDHYTDLYLLSLRTRASRRVTQNECAEGMPRFSPDGKWLAFTAPDGFQQMRNQKIYVAPVNGAAVAFRKLLAAWDQQAGSFYWGSDSRTLYFVEGVGADVHLFASDIEEGQPVQLTRERGEIALAQVGSNGRLLFSFTDPTTPADYYVASASTVADRASWTRVSRGNAQVADIALGAYETVRWRSSDGTTVEGILIKPVGYAPRQRYPTVVQLHGGPAGAATNSFSGGYLYYANVLAGAGYAVFQPNYRGSDNYGERFRMQIAGDYFRLGFEDIMTGVDALVARGIADPQRLAIMGWSAGGHWSNWALTHTDRFKAISTGAGAANWISMYAQSDIQSSREFYLGGTPWENWEKYAALSPLRWIRNAKTPTLIHAGESDSRVPKAQSDELHMALKKLGVPTEYIVYPGMSHSLTEPRYQMVKMVAEFNWFEKWVKGKRDWLDWGELLATVEDGNGREVQAADRAR